MEHRTPPPFATWLLTHFGSGHHIETVVGDLQERFRTHPSKVSYWRQVLLALVVSAFEEVLAHKILATRALLVGWATIFALFSYGSFLMIWFAYVMVWSDWAITSAPEWMRMASWSLVRRPLPLSYLGFFVGGVVVGFTHRNNRNGMLLLFITTVLVVLTASTSWVDWARPGPRPLHAWTFLVVPSSPNHWRLGFVFVPLAILLGGILGAGGLRRKDAPLVP
jgi:hypothetical protein